MSQTHWPVMEGWGLQRIAKMVDGMLAAVVEEEVEEYLVWVDPEMTATTLALRWSF